MKTYPVLPLNKVKRGPKRASHDSQQIHEILDATFLCHIGYTYEDQVIVIPTAYGRIGETLYIHGSLKNRMLLGLLAAKKASITVTHLDGIVLARSAFHHSANYRSVVAFGSVRQVEETEEKTKALHCLLEHMIPGHWDTVRQPNAKELDATLVVALTIETASAKVRTGDPVDEAADSELPIWAGVIPIRNVADTPISDPKLAPDITVPESVKEFITEHT